MGRPASMTARELFTTYRKLSLKERKTFIATIYVHDPTARQMLNQYVRKTVAAQVEAELNRPPSEPRNRGRDREIVRLRDEGKRFKEIGLLLWRINKSWTDTHGATLSEDTCTKAYNAMKKRDAAAARKLESEQNGTKGNENASSKTP